MAEKETAYVLPEEAASAMEEFTFAGFPGLWFPGRPVLVMDLGLTAAQAADLVKDLGLPLKKTTAKPRKGRTPASSATAPSEVFGGIAEGEQAGSPMPGLSREEFDAGVEESPVLGAMAAAEQGEPVPPPEPAEPPAPGAAAEEAGG